MKKNIAIIGAGYAGIAAALTIDPQKFTVTLYESKPYIGGRASSFYDPDFKTELDNGQHMLMSCYTETLKLLKKLNLDDQLYIQNRMKIQYRSEFTQFSLYAVPYLPAPFHILPSLLSRQIGLSLSEKFRLINFVFSLIYGSINKYLSVDDFYRQKKLF